jgi:hypothetical protein
MNKDMMGAKVMIDVEQRLLDFYLDPPCLRKTKARGIYWEDLITSTNINYKIKSSIFFNNFNPLLGHADIHY